MSTTSVKALRPESRNGFRIVLAQEWVRERFWVVPTALLGAGIAVGIAVSRADAIPGLANVGGRLPVRPGSAEALLGIIATSMLTFVGVVFTITLVALQLASAQLSPRVIRTFVRSGITKVAFGLFLATFACAIVVIIVEGASSSADVLRLADTLGVLFVLASLVVFVAYVTASRPWAVGAPRTAARLPAAALAKSGRVSPDRRCSDGGARCRLPGRRRSSSCVHLGQSRTMYQDPLYGIRQLVDVASQALSPAVNQPTTAVIVGDRLEELLLRIVRRPLPTGFSVDPDGVVRLIHPEPTWAEAVDLAFTEIAIYGAPSPAVFRRLAAAYERLHQSVPFDLRVDITRHIALLEPLASGAIQPEHPTATLGQIHEDLADSGLC